MTAEPLDEDQMSAMLERVLQQLQDAAAGPAADPALIALHGVALVLAATRRLLGRALPTSTEDPRHSRPDRSSNRTRDVDGLDEDLADVAAADQQRRERNRRLFAEGAWTRPRADPPRPVVIDRVAGTAPRGELEALHSQISQLSAADARFRREREGRVARDDRAARLGDVVIDQAIQIAELRTASLGPHAESVAGLDDRLDALDKRFAHIEAVHRGFLAKIAQVLGVSEGPAESLVCAVASTAADLKRSQAKVTDLEHHRNTAVKALAGLRAALTGALGLQGTTSDADAVGCVRQMMELLESTRTALDEAREVCARLAGRGPAEAPLPIPEYCAMVREKLDRIAAAHEAGVERWRAEDPDRRTMVLPPSREELVAWLLDKIPTGTTPSPTPEPIARRTLRIFGVDEAQVAKACVDVAPDGPAKISLKAKFPEVLIEITVGTATDEAEAEQLIGALESALRDRLGPALYGRGSETLVERVKRRLLEAAATFSTAESCTGGMVGELITSLPGASRVFTGGAIVYSNAEKERQLGVRGETLAAHGAVSKETVVEMALGALERFGTGLAVSISGIAGPDGGSSDKPVGTVWIGAASRLAPGDPVVAVRKLKLRGPRDHIRVLSAWWALATIDAMLPTNDPAVAARARRILGLSDETAAP